MDLFDELEKRIGKNVHCILSFNGNTVHVSGNIEFVDASDSYLTIEFLDLSDIIIKDWKNAIVDPTSGIGSYVIGDMNFFICDGDEDDLFG